MFGSEKLSNIDKAILFNYGGSAIFTAITFGLAGKFLKAGPAFKWGFGGLVVFLSLKSFYEISTRMAVADHMFEFTSEKKEEEHVHGH